MINDGCVQLTVVQTVRLLFGIQSLGSFKTVSIDFYSFLVHVDYQIRLISMLLMGQELSHLVPMQNI